MRGAVQRNQTRRARQKAEKQVGQRLGWHARCRHARSEPAKQLGRGRDEERGSVLKIRKARWRQAGPPLRRRPPASAPALQRDGGHQLPGTQGLVLRGRLPHRQAVHAEAAGQLVGLPPAKQPLLGPCRQSGPATRIGAAGSVSGRGAPRPLRRRKSCPLPAAHPAHTQAHNKTQAHLTSGEMSAYSSDR